MDTTLNTAESMDKAKKWMSIGAGLAGFTLMLYWMITGIGFSEGLFSVLLILFLPPLAAAGALWGTGFICQKGPRFLNRLPAPMLLGLGLILGGLIVIIVTLYAGLKVIGEIASAFSF